MKPPGTLIVGAGFAGSVMARELAEAGHHVHAIGSRPHIAGNAYDELDAHGVLVHYYKPHICHTGDDRMPIAPYKAAYLALQCRIEPPYMVLQVGGG